MQKLVLIIVTQNWFSIQKINDCSYSYVRYCIADKFLPFKTPLDSRYDDQITDECRFDVDMLFMSIRRNKVGSFARSEISFKICVRKFMFILATLNV